MAWFNLSALGITLSALLTRQRIAFEASVRLPTPAVIPPPNHAPEPPARGPADDAGSLANAIAAHRWYHTIDLGNGVRTPGYFDHDPYLPLYRLPESLAGKRVLDVATFDGYWAFQFERRGAAEVVALDLPNAAGLDLSAPRRAAMSAEELARPFGGGFALAAEALKSKVRRVEASVYDLSPERHGLFDLVHIGDVLLHLRDPVRALACVRSVTRETAIISDCFWPDLDRWPERRGMVYEGGAGENVWWRLGAETIRAMIRDAGFGRVEELARFRYGGTKDGPNLHHVVFVARP
ncbi:MAG: methyltransferase domain-containing protein [Alphaproteobacteria bacterium]|nr:methyltransferase domain-containing protein [Alphaproteobacteria bacterium]